MNLCLDHKSCKYILFLTTTTLPMKQNETQAQHNKRAALKVMGNIMF